jgi:hypothetical protein
MTAESTEDPIEERQEIKGNFGAYVDREIESMAERE